MDSNEFGLALLGDPMHTADGKTRIRYIVAEAIDERAAERQSEGRPDIAGRLCWASLQIRTGNAISKRVAGKLNKDLRIVESRVVDGVSIGRYPGSRNR